MLGVLLALSGVLSLSNWQIVTVGSFDCVVVITAPSDVDVDHLELWERYNYSDLLVDDSIPCKPGATVSKVVSVQEGRQEFKVLAVDSVGNKSVFSPDSVVVRGVAHNGQFYVVTRI